LCAGGDLTDDAVKRDGTGHGEARGKGLLLHVVGKNASIGGETGECNTIV